MRTDNKNFLVSVIVPIYNVEDYLRRCLDSILQQTLDGIEIIAVNDGSTDSSFDILCEYAEKYDNIVVVDKVNGGLSSARNVGIDMARGEYIGFVDSDDFICEDMFFHLYNAAVSNNAEISLCAYNRFDEIEKTYKKISVKAPIPFNKSLSEDYSLLNTAPYAWNKLFKATFIKNSSIRFPQGIVYEDIATVYPLLDKANKITIVDIPLYNYCINRQGSIISNSKNNSIQLIDSLEIFSDYFNSQKISDEGISYVCNVAVRHIFNRFKEFKKYYNREAKLEFLNSAFCYLDNAFPLWRKDIYFISKKGKLRSFFKRNILTSKFIWTLRILYFELKQEKK